MKYSKSFKTNIINLYKKGTSSTSLILKYDIPKSTFYEWIKPYKQKTLSKQTQNDLVKYRNLIKSYEALKLEHDITNACHCFKDDSSDIKLAAIESNYGKYPTKTMCRILEVAPGTFNHYHKRQTYKTKTETRFDDLKVKILEIYKMSEERFGYTKITAKLNQAGISVSDKTVNNLMNELGISAKLKNKKKPPVQKPNTNPYLINRVKRSFIKNKPNDTWVGDIISIKVQGNTYYLCVIIDLFSRKIIGYRVHYNAKNNLVINVLKDAFESRDEPNNLIFHSDRGSEYTSYEYMELLKSLGIKSSFSDTANPYDNAVVESFFSHLKKEEIYRRIYLDLNELKESIDKYIKFYNDYRPHETLGNLSPNEFEQKYYDIKKKDLEIPD